jgi:acyl-CoA thioester hydrolase
VPAIFSYEHTVSDTEIDGQGHANNVVYLAWMQAAALAHSTAQGWPPEAYRQLGGGWVVRSHEIRYRMPAFAGDRIVVRTWVADFRRVSSLRQYRIERTTDGILLAQAATQWAFIDYRTQSVVRVPEAVTGAFQVVEHPSIMLDDAR